MVVGGEEAGRWTHMYCMYPYGVVQAYFTATSSNNTLQSCMEMTADKRKHPVVVVRSSCRGCCEHEHEWLDGCGL